MKFTLFHAASLVLAISSVSALPRPRTNAHAKVHAKAPNQVKVVKMVDTSMAKSHSMSVSKKAQAINKDSVDNTPEDLNDMFGRVDYELKIIEDFFDELSMLADDIQSADMRNRQAVDDMNTGDKLALLNLLDIIKSLTSQITAVTDGMERLDSQSFLNNLLLPIDHAGSLLMTFESELEGQNYPDVERYISKFVMSLGNFKSTILSLKNTMPSKSDDIVLDKFDDLDIAGPTMTAMVKRQEPRRKIQSKGYKHSTSAIEVPKAKATHPILPQEVIDAFAEFDDSRPEIAEMANAIEEAVEEATPTPTMI
ncbi:hypothetical protein INT43_004352 [Umbelopsis isabellina]|uniref:Uncharacterized protein n=1 Tax=Mortierella isabellina TaxID=91625 RepID=A0A8H7PHV3_MORIS|nr:hypothetical protein INT43_004352 [Umbelopsis isabellina]